MSKPAALAALAICAACAARVPGPNPPRAPAAERIVFLGDSLVHRSEKDHGLVSRLQARLARQLPDRPLLLLERGRNGDSIADLDERLEADALAERPAALVLYWDSDCSDVDESRLRPTEVAHLRLAYSQRLASVLSRLRRAGVRVLVAGPTLLGEQPHGRNPRDAQLDAYATLNRRLAQAYGARYVDTRAALLAWLRHHRPASGHGLLLTEDGEHLNARGSALVASQLERALVRWAQAGLPGPGAGTGGTARTGAAADRHSRATGSHP